MHTFCRRAINFINNNYINQGQFPELEQWDFLEYLNQDKQPWQDNKKQIWCDPGHALEFIGLALKVYYAIKSCSPKHKKEIQSLEKMANTIFLPTLIHVFDYGYQTNSHGIMKAYNLKDRNAINSDMPWWSLPETIRAVSELKSLVKESNDLDRILNTAHQAHQNHFLRKDFHLYAYQTRGINNKAIDIIPAMPDTDPIYHTGLSLIDALKHI